MNNVNKKIAIGVLSILVVIGLAFSYKFVFAKPFPDCKDGTYIGEGTGYRKHLKTKVTFKSGKITDIEIIEQYEKGKEHYEVPFEKIPQDIINQQSTDVEIVAGSTLTSKGIMMAVEDAVEKAKE